MPFVDGGCDRKEERHTNSQYGVRLVWPYTRTAVPAVWETGSWTPWVTSNLQGGS